MSQTSSSKPKKAAKYPKDAALFKELVEEIGKHPEIHIDDSATAVINMDAVLTALSDHLRKALTRIDSLRGHVSKTTNRSIDTTNAFIVLERCVASARTLSSDILQANEMVSGVVHNDYAMNTLGIPTRTGEESSDSESEDVDAFGDEDDDDET